nr:response regulator [Candidatus Solirubrobacter pratensis]
MAHVLLLEDDQDIAEALTGEGYDVATAGDGSIALDAVLEAPPDLIILDIGLPGIDGLEVCRQARELRPQLPISC